ncbi:hypothetical protein R1sor_010203 [Riccia sorocarpa]|uniref:Uncharacterized protein n=1 Tax=Riccia sorocarpa TaxID=122646 RepID=A0ABD3I018_9MARC
MPAPSISFCIKIEAITREDEEAPEICITSPLQNLDQPWGTLIINSQLRDTLQANHKNRRMEESSLTTRREVAHTEALAERLTALLQINDANGQEPVKIEIRYVGNQHKEYDQALVDTLDVLLESKEQDKTVSSSVRWDQLLLDSVVISSACGRREPALEGESACGVRERMVKR